MSRMLKIDPNERISLDQIKNHPMIFQASDKICKRLPVMAPRIIDKSLKIKELLKTLKNEQITFPKKSSLYKETYRE